MLTKWWGKLRLANRQQRVLLGMTVAFSGSLVLLLYFSLPAYPALPPIFPTLAYQPWPTATPGPPLAMGAWPGGTSTPTNSLPPWLGSGGTPVLGEQPGATSTPSVFIYFFPVTSRDEGGNPFTVDIQPEPPASVPEPEWPAGIDHLTGSKLGIHSVRNSDPWMWEFIRRARPRVVKAVDDVGWLADVKGASPNTITIGRFNGQDEGWVGTVDPAAAADAYIDHWLPAYRANGGADLWEGWNEFQPGTPERMRWYAEFEARRACRMQELGLHAAVGGFSVGVPEYDMMRQFLPALYAAARCGGIFTLHEYSAPTLDCGTRTGGAATIPGAPDLGGVTVGALTLRYRVWYEAILKPAGLGDLPLVISELGIESQPATAACGDPGGRAWKSYQDYWTRSGLGSGPQAYVNTLAWYDAQMRQDPYVLGATIFTAGALGSGDGWNAFDIHDILVPLAYYAVGQ